MVRGNGGEILHGAAGTASSLHSAAILDPFEINAYGGTDHVAASVAMPMDGMVTSGLVNKQPGAPIGRSSRSPKAFPLAPNRGGRVKSKTGH